MDKTALGRLEAIALWVKSDWQYYSRSQSEQALQCVDSGAIKRAIAWTKTKTFKWTPKKGWTLMKEDAPDRPRFKSGRRRVSGKGVMIYVPLGAVDIVREVIERWRSGGD